jgi:hypothetical protein
MEAWGELPPALPLPYRLIDNTRSLTFKKAW